MGFVVPAAAGWTSDEPSVRARQALDALDALARGRHPRAPPADERECCAAVSAATLDALVAHARAAARAEPARPDAVEDALAGRPLDGNREELATTLHVELRALARRAAGLDLALGEALRRLTRELGVADLGHCRAKDLAPVRYGFSDAQARELRTLAEGLRHLPALREGFLAGTISRTRLRPLLPVATPDTDAAWARLAAALSVRQLRTAVRLFLEQRLDPNAEGAADMAADEPPSITDEPDVMTRLPLRLRRSDAAVLQHWGRAMVGAVIGHRPSDGELIEALAADALASLGPPRDEPLEELVALEREQEAGRAEVAARSAKALRERPRSEPDERASADPAETAWDVHERAARFVRERQQLEWQRARLLDALDAHALHVELGHATLWSYLRLDLELAPREGHGALELLRDLRDRPPLEQAWRDGDVSLLKLRLVARVARPETAAAWLEVARTATWRRLQAEVSRQEALRDVVGEAEWLALNGGLPTPESDERVLGPDWREIFGCREAARAAAGECTGVGDVAGAAGAGGQCIGWSGDADDAHGGGECAGDDAADDEAGAGGECTGEADHAPASGDCTGGGGAADDAGTGGECTGEGAAVPTGHSPSKGERAAAAAITAAARAAGLPFPGQPRAARPRPAADCERPFGWAVHRLGFTAEMEGLRRPTDAVIVELVVPPSVAQLYTQAKLLIMEAHGGWPFDVDTIHYMLRSFAATHCPPEVERELSSHPVVERDGWACQMPLCSATQPLHVHHVWYRSRGGPDDEWNLLTACEGCHRLVHAGKIAVVGRAPGAVVFLVGLRDGGTPREAYRNGFGIRAEAFRWQGGRLERRAA